MGLSSTPSEATSFQTEAYRLVVEVRATLVAVGQVLLGLMTDMAAHWSSQAKMLAVYEILSRGLNVFFADVDIVLNRDPVGDFRGDVGLFPWISHRPFLTMVSLLWQVDLIFQPDWGLAEGQDPDIMT